MVEAHSCAKDGGRNVKGGRPNDVLVGTHVAPEKGDSVDKAALRKKGRGKAGTGQNSSRVEAKSGKRKGGVKAANEKASPRGKVGQEKDDGGGGGGGKVRGGGGGRKRNRQITEVSEMSVKLRFFFWFSEVQ